MVITGLHLNPIVISIINIVVVLTMITMDDSVGKIMMDVVVDNDYDG